MQDDRTIKVWVNLATKPRTFHDLYVFLDWVVPTNSIFKTIYSNSDSIDYDASGDSRNEYFEYSLTEEEYLKRKQVMKFNKDLRKLIK